MGLNSIQQYVKGLLDGQVTTPDYTVPLVAYITPPTPGYLDGPAAYIWGARSALDLQTAPRGAGYFKDVWSININVIVADASDYAGADYAFPRVIDAIIEILRKTPIPVVYTDPQTGLTTQILDIGNKITIEYGDVLGFADAQEWIYYSAMIVATLEEKVQYI